MARTPRLELTWIGKEQRPKLEPRILLEDPAKSYHAPHRVTDHDQFDNRLIFGDNLLALKALEQEFTGKVKCVYVDPPFNTKQAFEHYDDGLEHSLWLGMMRDRLELIRRLLHPSGSLFVHIDDNELGYLVATADEIFGRGNRISIVSFKQSAASGPKAINPGLVTTSSFVLYYARNRASWKPNRVYVRVPRDDRYSKVIDNPHDAVEGWRLVPLRDAFCRQYGTDWRGARERFGDRIESRIERFVLENAAQVVRTARVAPKDVNEESRAALAQSLSVRDRVVRVERNDRQDHYFLNGEQLIFYASKTQVVDGQRVTAAPVTTIWDDMLSNNLHNEGGVSFPNGKKPEALIKRCIELSTEEGDVVLDSFAGSGTTGAVAHKMGRRWIMVELGDHCHTHIIPRLRKVIDGEDAGGVTEATGWKGGGGFRYYRLAPSLLQQDSYGQWVINKDYNAAMLAEAVCKIEGFAYAPSDVHYWQHGKSTERDFIWVTTQHLTHQRLLQLSDEVGPERSLLALCTSFQANPDDYPNLTVKKIPGAVLSRCEWGKDDYSLAVADLPAAPPAPGQQGLDL